MTNICCSLVFFMAFRIAERSNFFPLFSFVAAVHVITRNSNFPSFFSKIFDENSWKSHSVLSVRFELAIKVKMRHLAACLAALQLILDFPADLSRPDKLWENSVTVISVKIHGSWRTWTRALLHRYLRPYIGDFVSVRLLIFRNYIIAKNKCWIFSRN